MPAAAQRLNILLIGPPGAGKGTQSDHIIQMYGLKHLSTGDMLRQAIADNTPLGRTAKAFMDRGEFVPDQVVHGLIREKLESPGFERGFIMDGFPRNVAQAAGLEQLLSGMGIRVSTVIAFSVNDEEIVKRLSGRLTCMGCGATFHRHFKPPKEEEICDVCGSDLTTRPDDAVDTIRKRLRVYREQTLPAVEYFRAKNLVFDVDGLGSPDAVWRRIHEHLDVLAGA